MISKRVSKFLLNKATFTLTQNTFIKVLFKKKSWTKNN